MSPITPNHTREAYDRIAALNISRLKEIKRSPLHYKYALTHPRTSPAMTLGTATHIAVLEPERYASHYAVWGSRTAGGNMSPRKGQAWDAFCAEHAGRSIITADEDSEAKAISAAVRGDARAAALLAAGDAEVTLEWMLPPELGNRPARGRVDWITTLNGRACLVGLKTARDCRHFIFGSAAAKLEYPCQWAYYFDGYVASTGEVPLVREIVVESSPPYACAIYRIEDDIIEEGRERYWEMAKLLAECEATDTWPGPEPVEIELTMPSWYYGTAEDDLSGLDLETDK